MKTVCPHCGQHYDVDKEYIDQIVECVVCGKEFVVKEISEAKTTPINNDSRRTNTIPNNTAIIQDQQSARKMKALVCEMCGSTDLIKQNGLFVCQSCGIKYSMEEARKMMIDGTVNVAGTVKVDMSEKLKNLYTLARRAKDEQNSENATKYYDLILQEDPESWEASFYQVYFKAWDCKVEEIASASSSIENRLKNTLSLIVKHLQNETERNSAFCEITNMTVKIASMFCDAMTKTYYGIDADIRGQFTQKYTNALFSTAKMCYTLGDLLDSFNHSKNLSCIAWKKAIAIHVKVGTNKYMLDQYTTKIRKTEPDYKRPFSGCYIATAVYGTYDCPEVWTLRRFRDFSLGNNSYGRLLIKMYYAVSPTLVKLFGHTKVFNLFWKKELDKLVTILNSQGVSSAPYNDRSW